METQVRSKNGDGGSPVTNLGALLSGVNVVPVMPPGEGGGQEVLAESGSTPAAGNGNNGNGTAAPENGVGMSEAVAETATVVTPDTKFVFRTWLMAGIFIILKRFLKHVDLGALFREGNGPDQQRDSWKIVGGWRKLQKLLAACKDNHEAWRSTLLAIIAGIEEKTGKGREFTFVDAAKNTKVVKEVGFGLAWALNADDRAELVNAILALEEGIGMWFGTPQAVGADYRVFIEKNRQREDARQQKRLARDAEEARIEEFAEIGNLLNAAQDVGVELTTIVSREAIAAAQARLPEVGETVNGKFDQLMVGENDEGQTFVSGFRFERLPGRREMPFLPARFIPDRWRRFEDETVEQYEQRLKASMAGGTLLSVEKVEKDERGLRVLVQIRTPEELVAMKSCGRHNPFARPPRKLEEGESVTGRVAGRSQYGVRVAFRGGIQLFAHGSNIAEGLSLEVGDDVAGVVIPGHDGREFDLAIRERIVEEDEDEEVSAEYIVHPARVEEIRVFVVDSGMELDEAMQTTFRGIVEMAKGLRVLSEDEQEAVHTFFGAILKGAGRRFGSVIVALKEYRREQEEAAEEPQGEADSRPFCTNHEAGDGEQCNRRVAEEGAFCVRCQRRAAGHPSRPGAKKRGAKCRKPKGG